MADCRNLKLCGMLHCHFVGMGGSNYFPMSYGGSQGVAGVKIYCVHLSLQIPEWRLETLYILIFIWRCVYYQDGRIFLRVMVDPRGVEGVLYLVLTSRWPIGETWNFVQCFIVICRCLYIQNGRIQQCFEILVDP
jgi:hypothetical protein